MRALSAKLLIINADDLGYDPAITRGIVESIKSGIVSSTTLMVNTPFTDSAAAAAKEFSVGLHFNLARFQPAYHQFPSELLRNGEFLESNVAKIPPAVVAQELRAQISQFEAKLSRKPSHVDVHKHLHRHSNILTGVLDAAAKHGLPVRSIDPQMRLQMRLRNIATNDAFNGEDSVDAYWTKERFEQAIAAIDEGVTELMCHPGYRPEAIKTAYSEQREVELKTLLDPSLRRLLENANIQLTSYRALSKE